MTAVWEGHIGSVTTLVGNASVDIAGNTVVAIESSITAVGGLVIAAGVVC